MNYKAILFLFISFGLSCNKKEPLQSRDIIGLWKIELDIDQERTIPFFLEIIDQQGKMSCAIWNGNEKIEHKTVDICQDSLIVNSPYFNSTMYMRFNKNVVTGHWVDHSREAYKMPLHGKYNLSQRFKFKGLLEHKIDGKWAVKFSPDTEDAYDAIGLFSTDSNSMKGTFITETGDYRYLEGGFATNELKLSTFDGAHAFLFEAELSNDTLRGWFYSGKNWKEPFIAWRNDSATLINPYDMTELVDKSKPISFAFKDLDGNIVSLEDSVYQDKPVLVQIMGSWCPNCMDESAFLAKNAGYIKENDVEIIALSFERLDYESALKPLQKIKNNLGLNYLILYAGHANKKEATLAIPWLKEIKSYPTLLYVLPDKRVFKIHTGFYGPGTGNYFDIQSKEMLEDIKNLGDLSKAIR
ncbi:MAG: thiol-disulfide isomerase/thioredoxin [Bacteroidia bacterium]|jgi:thiol-disulfide isomerase/thioredoxin